MLHFARTVLVALMSLVALSAVSAQLSSEMLSGLELRNIGPRQYERTMETWPSLTMAARLGTRWRSDCPEFHPRHG